MEKQQWCVGMVIRKIENVFFYVQTDNTGKQGVFLFQKLQTQSLKVIISIRYLYLLPLVYTAPIVKGL